MSTITFEKLGRKMGVLGCSSTVIMHGNSRGRKRSEPFCGSRASFLRFHFAISRRSIRHQGIEQFPRDLRHAVYRPGERMFVHFGRSGEAAQFSDKLERRCPDFFLCRWRCKIMKRSDVSAHDRPSSIVDPGSTISRCRRSLPQ